jgi:hypothetical protein
MYCISAEGMGLTQTCTKKRKLSSLSETFAKVSGLCIVGNAILLGKKKSGSILFVDDGL